MNTMLRRSGAGLAVLAVVLLLAACQSTTGRTLGENIDDAGITTRSPRSPASTWTPTRVWSR